MTDILVWFWQMPMLKGSNTCIKSWRFWKKRQGITMEHFVVTDSCSWIPDHLFSLVSQRQSGTNSTWRLSSCKEGMENSKEDASVDTICAWSGTLPPKYLAQQVQPLPSAFLYNLYLVSNGTFAEKNCGWGSWGEEREGWRGKRKPTNMTSDVFIV